MPACATPSKPGGGGFPVSTITRVCPAARRWKPECGACGGAWPRLSDRVRTRSTRTAVFLDRIVEQREAGGRRGGKTAASAPSPRSSASTPPERRAWRRATSRECRSGRATPASWTDGLRVRCPPSGRICVDSSRSRPRSARSDALFRPAERDRSADQPLQRAQPRRAGQLPAGDARQMPHLRSDARQHRAPQRAVGVAAGEFLEMHDPGEDARRRDIGTPCHRVPCRAVGKPALDQHAGRVARRRADRRSDRRASRTRATGDSHSAAASGGNQAGVGRRISSPANSMSPARIGVAAPRIARPALVELQPQRARRRSDQRLAIKRRGRQRPPGVAPPLRERIPQRRGTTPARRLAAAPARGPTSRTEPGRISSAPGRAARAQPGTAIHGGSGQAVRRLKPSRLVTRKAAPGKRAPHAPAADRVPRSEKSARSSLRASRAARRRTRRSRHIRGDGRAACADRRFR